MSTDIKRMETTAVMEPPMEVPEVHEPLTGHDYCDQCGVAQARVRLTKEPGKSALQFCGHHFHVNQESLKKAGFEAKQWASD